MLLALALIALFIYSTYSEFYGILYIRYAILAVLMVDTLLYFLLLEENKKYARYDFRKHSFSVKSEIIGLCSYSIAS